MAPWSRWACRCAVGTTPGGPRCIAGQAAPWSEALTRSPATDLRHHVSGGCSAGPQLRGRPAGHDYVAEGKASGQRRHRAGHRLCGTTSGQEGRWRLRRRGCSHYLTAVRLAGHSWPLQLRGQVSPQQQQPCNSTRPAGVEQLASPWPSSTVTAPGAPPSPHGVKTPCSRSCSIARRVPWAAALSRPARRPQ
jgi:hypothetical protein